jgi:molecular chaperone DnaJ
MLSDPKKKEAYDTYGSSAFGAGGFDPTGGAGAGPQGNPFAGFGGFPGGGQAGGFGADFNFEDLFSAFGGQPGRGRRARGGFQEEILVGDNIEVQTNISFMDAAKGTSKEIHITPLVQCKTCTGSGLKKGVQRTSCKSCGGTGMRTHTMGGFQMASTCTTCGGAGIQTPKGGECSTCHGDGAIRERKTISIDIPGGVEDGMRLRVAGEGDAALTGQVAGSNVRSQKGDLYVFIRVAPDNKFQRNGSDILYTASIPMTTAILGGEIKVPTLDGEVRVKVPTGTSAGDKITLGGMGMKKLQGRRNAHGDLRVEFKVQTPKYLSANQRTLLEMLADEMGDKSAKRVMNIPRHDGQSQDPSTSTTASNDAHKNEGFLKNAWHNLTGQHKKTEPAKPDSEEPEEPKKASGSG